MTKKYKVLFSKICCSHCKNDITEDAFSLIRKDKGQKVVRMVCPHCGKDFGIGFLKVHEGVGQPNTPLNIEN